MALTLTKACILDGSGLLADNGIFISNFLYFDPPTLLRPKPYFDFFGQTLLRPKPYFDFFGQTLLRP